MHRKPVHSDNEDAYFRARKRTRFVVVVALLILACSTISAFANPTVQTRWITYAVTGTTVDTILRQMQENGPNGFWAYTSWYVRWTASCQVTVEINYTMPKHARREAMPAHIRVEWDQMVAALKSHEKQHGVHGVNAANELVQKRCRNGNAIVQKWAEQDRVYDRMTGHGRTEGVTFP